MPAITTKQQLLTRAQAALKKKYDAPEPEATDRTVLEELIYAACRENATTAEADRAYASLRKAFIDWNEVRVSTVQEVADSLRPLPQPGARAKRIVALLQAVFEERYSYDLSDVLKKGLKDTARKLRFYKEGVNDFAVAWVIQRTLGGHAVPIDDATLRALQEFGIVEPGEPESMEALRASLEHMIPKASGIEFTELFSLHARDAAIEEAKRSGKSKPNAEAAAKKPAKPKKPR
jgi:endonuclease-3